MSSSTESGSAITSSTESGSTSSAEETRPAEQVVPATSGLNSQQVATQNTAKNLAEQLRGSKPGPFPPVKPTENEPVKNNGPGVKKQETPKSLEEALKGVDVAEEEKDINDAEKIASGDKKPDGTTAKSDKVRYFYTQSEFWGGPTLSYTMYAILAIFPLTGFLGLDHMYMRSPGTGLAKCVFNFLSLGMWYFYDLIQAVKDKNDIYEYGVSMPLYGPSGIGAGSFIGQEEEEDDEKKNNNGATNAVATNAGATNAGAKNAVATNAIKNNAGNSQSGPTPANKGATMATEGQQGGGSEEGKKVTGSPLSFMIYSFATFFIPFGFEYLAAGDFRGFVGKFLLTFIGIGLIIGLLNIIKLISHPEQVLCEGTSRRLMPFLHMQFKEAYFMKEGCEGADSGESSGGWFSGIFTNLIKRIPFLREIYAVTTEVAKATVKGVGEVAKGVPLVTGIASTAATLKGGAQQLEVAQTQMVQQIGGAQSADGFSSTILSFTLALVFIGAAFLKGKEFVAEAANKTTGRPVELGKFLWRKKNVDDLPPAAPEPGIF